MFVNIPSAKLKQLVKLSERKEALLAEIQEIDRAMLRLERQFGQGRTEAVRKAPLTFSIVPERGGHRRQTRMPRKRSLSSAARKG